MSEAAKELRRMADILERDAEVSRETFRRVEPETSKEHWLTKWEVATAIAKKLRRRAVRISK